jgi:hypothetical protein
MPFAAALAAHPRTPFAFFPAALSRADSHLLGPPSGRSFRTAVTHRSTRHSHAPTFPEHGPAVSALATAVLNFDSALERQAARLLVSPVAAALA